jgi:hypothetical protein
VERGFVVEEVNLHYMIFFIFISLIHMSKLDTTLEMIRDKTFVSIREIQRSPSKALDGFKIILNNGKMQ